MTLKPPYRGRTLKDVPPTETFTRPRVVIVYWCSRWRPRTCVERRTASKTVRALPGAVGWGARGSLGRRRVLPSKTPN